MKKFEGILLCTDLDGTLLNDEHTVSRENAEAIEYFKEKGGSFTFITGRPYYTARKSFEMAKPNVPFGCLNGGGIYDPWQSKYVMHRALDREALVLVDYIIEKIPDIAVHVYTPHITYFSRTNEASKLYSRVVGMDITTKDHHSVDAISKIVLAHTDQSIITKLSEIVSTHPLSEKFGFIRSEKTLYEILPKENSKGNLLYTLAEHLGIDTKRTIAVGDYNNDVSMIAAACVGIAVSNAVDEAKAIADRITVSNTEHAIAKIISELDGGIIKL